jgi:hypothetical protein
MHTRARTHSHTHRNNSYAQVGTAHALSRLFDASRAAARRGAAPGHARAVALHSHLRAVVVDEADQQLCSGSLAEATRRRRDGAAAARARGAPLSHRERAQLSRVESASACELLLAEGLPVPLSSVQLVCATATVGRTLRRQLQTLTGAPTIEKAAKLVSAGEGRGAKAAAVRRAALMPPTLEHRYVLRPPLTAAAGADISAACRELSSAVRKLPPADALVFAGRAAVAQVAAELRALGLEGVRAMPAEREQQQEDVEGGARSWSDATLYVASERWGRGLDLGVDYVFVLAPPATPAAYMHLAGRTARSGRRGVAVSILRAEQAPRLVGFAEALGVAFRPLE